MHEAEDRAQRSVLRRMFPSPARAEAALVGILLYALITAARSGMIASGLASLFWSAVLVLQHPSSASSVIDPALVEYWVAAFIWCAAPVPLAVMIFRRRRASLRDEAAPPSASPAAYVLALFVMTALCAPIVAPLPPLAQGDLLHTRFLPPLSSGVCTVVSAHTAISDNASLPERMSAEAAAALLHRSTVFSGTSDPLKSPEGHSFPIIFLFGTDAVGRDIFSRVVYGSRYSIGIGIMVVLISVVAGSGIGMAAGYTGGIADTLVMRTIDVLMSVPTLFLVLALMAILGQSVAAMIAVLAATEWMGIARIVRGEVMHLREREFISASRLLGTSTPGILWMHVLPNIRPALMNTAILQLGNIFLAEASLSFLGLGVLAPNPSWGNMIADSMDHGNAGLGGGIFPGLALSALIVAVHVIGSPRRDQSLRSRKNPIFSHQFFDPYGSH
ncbi:MAG: ABC transporter permease [Acidobacteriota bacterium]